MHRGVALALVLVLVGVAARGDAQTTDADALTRHGLALRRQRRDADALRDFQRAYAMVPEPRTLAQVALAEQALGLWVDAEAHLRTALEAKDPWIEQRRTVLTAGLADIQTHLGGLEVETDVAGAELWVNGTRVATLPIAHPLRVEAGSVVIEVRAPEHASARRLTSVEAGETAHETIHLVPLVPPAAIPEVGPAQQPKAELVDAQGGSTSPPRIVPRDRAMRTTSLVILGAAAAGLAVGTYFGIRTFVTKSDRDAHCPQGVCDPQGLALDKEARTLADWSTASFALGIVAAGTGAALFWMSRGSTVPGKMSALRFDFGVNVHGCNAALGGLW
jgi:hypothetical protein